MKADAALQGPQGAAGFVLPVVAIAIAVFALSVLTLVSTVDAAATRAARLKEDAAFARRAATAEARVAFLLATEPQRPGAIAVGGDRSEPIDTLADPRDRRVRLLHLDGRGYVTTVEGHALRVSLQDVAGLVNVNVADALRLARVFESAGADAASAGPAGATLADFIDADDLRRPGGAERRDYASSGLAPPPDTPLVDVREANAALGWSVFAPPAVTRRFVDLTSAGDIDAGLNVNTAPAPVIAAVFGVDLARAEELVRRRDTQIIRTADDLAALMGGGFQSEGVPFASAPGPSIRLKIAGGEGRSARELTTSLIFARSRENPPIGVGPREISPGPEQRSSDERLEPLPAGGRFPPR